MRNCSQKVGVGLLLCMIAVTASAGSKGQLNEGETKEIVKAIPSPIRFEVSREVAAGRIVRHQEGAQGSVHRTYRVMYKDGKPVGKEEISELTIPAKPTIFLVGRAGHSFSRGSFVRHKVLDMRATSYYSMVCGTGRTATGERAKYGVVAVDPRVIPLGTVVFVEGYGLALACDTGGAIKGNRIDLCFENRHTMATFQNKTVKVHILE